MFCLVRSPFLVSVQDTDKYRKREQNNMNLKLTNLLSRQGVALGTTLLVLAMATVPAIAGRVGGAVCQDDSVMSGYSKTYSLTFRGGERAAVEASGDGDIDIYVYDSDGDLVVKDSLSDAHPVAVWYPRYTDTYKVRIVNADAYEVDYHLDTN
jgi:hypothetical protein